VGTLLPPLVPDVPPVSSDVVVTGAGVGVTTLNEPTDETAVPKAPMGSHEGATMAPPTGVGVAVCFPFPAEMVEIGTVVGMPAPPPVVTIGWLKPLTMVMRSPSFVSSREVRSLLPRLRP